MDSIVTIVDWEGNSQLENELRPLLPATADTATASMNAALGGTLYQDAPLHLACDARIDNRQALQAALGCPGEAEDASLILAAYARWGEECPAHLVGDFTFILWDDARRTLLAARDGLGMRTLFYRQEPHRLCLAGEVEQLLDCFDSPAKPDLLSLAGWVSGWPDPQRSLFEGIEMLPPGHLLVARDGQVTLRKFWDIDPSRTLRYRRPEEYASHLRELLRRAVHDRMRSHSDLVATQMSGGMDSTTVTALARQNPEKALLVVSHTYRETTGCDESALIHEMIDHLGIERYRFLAAEDHLDLDYRMLYPPTAESPGTVRSPRYRDEMALLAAEGVKVLLTGSGGDEMTWGHALTYSQRLKRGEPGVIAEVIRGCRELELPLLRTLRQLFVGPLLPAGLKRALGRGPDSIRLPPWVSARAVQQLELKERLPVGASVRFSNPALQARYDALRHTATFNSVRSYARVGREYGIDVRHPFFDTRLAEFSFAIPDDLWIREGYPKWLLRRSMDGLLPDSVCWNRNKVVFDSFFTKVIRSQGTRVRELLANRQLEEMGLVDTQRLLQAYDETVAGKRAFNVDLLYAVMTQAWVQEFGREGSR